jgi:hypothetical protein
MERQSTNSTAKQINESIRRIRNNHKGVAETVPGEEGDGPKPHAEDPVSEPLMDGLAGTSNEVTRCDCVC